MNTARPAHHRAGARRNANRRATAALLLLLHVLTPAHDARPPCVVINKAYCQRYSGRLHTPRPR